MNKCGGSFTNAVGVLLISRVRHREDKKLGYAVVAQLVEHRIAISEVFVGSRPIYRSKYVSMV